MLRPRDGRQIQIESSQLHITPPHRLNWIIDVYGNNVTMIHFTYPTTELMIYSEMTVNQLESNPFDFTLESEAATYPFHYDNKTAIDLAPLMQPVCPADTEQVRQWLGMFWLPGQQIDTMGLLGGLNTFIPRAFLYNVRDEAGVQSPSETLAKKSGTCRDFATLFIESCRCLGLAARFVSGYVQTPQYGGSVHAWAEVYLPGGGWRAFDPTFGLLSTSQHFPVGVSRHPEDAMPIVGSYSFVGATIDVTMDVSLKVEQIAL
jgi:transglutaminase-like putative cysteine protease